MSHVSDHAPWRANFIGTLRLLGEAAARQPFGIPDPVLCGASAVELYTGGLWSVAGLEVLASDRRSLTAELFATGFRWTQRPRHRSRGLWHPELQIGIDVLEDRAPQGLAELSNVLTVAIDLGLIERADRQPVSLKVVGIEDLIVEEFASRTMHGTP